MNGNICSTLGVLFSGGGWTDNNLNDFLLHCSGVDAVLAVLRGHQFPCIIGQGKCECIVFV